MLGTPLLKLLYKNEGLAGTWSADTEVATLPASNLKDGNRNRVHRTTGLAAPNWWKVDLGSAKAIGAVAFVGSNLRAGKTVTIKGHTADAWSTPDFSTTFTSWTSDVGVMVKFLAATQTFRWWRFESDDTGNPDGYLQTGVIIPSPVVALTRAPRAFRWGVVDPSLVGYAPGGTPHRSERPDFVLVEFDQGFTAESLVFGDLQTALREAGLHKDLVLSLFPDGPSGDDLAKAVNLYGAFVDLPPFTYAPTLAGTDYDWGPIQFRESR